MDDPDLFQTGVAATVDCNARYVYLHPYEGAKAAVAEAARNLSCVGAEPLAVTDNLNFGSPENPIGYWQLAEACRGLADACREFATPVTGGNVSLYNETLDSDGKPAPIYPTPVVGMVGLIPNLNYIAGQGWLNQGDAIYLLGLPADATSEQISFGGSEYLAAIHQTIAGTPPVIDFDLERRVQAACREGIRQGWVASAHDCAEGGLAIALAEACISSGKGADITLPISDPTAPPPRQDHILFAEGGARILVSVVPELSDRWEAYLETYLSGAWQKIGQVGGSTLQIAIVGNSPLISATIVDMTVSWSEAIERRLAV